MRGDIFKMLFDKMFSIPMTKKAFYFWNINGSQFLGAGPVVI